MLDVPPSLRYHFLDASGRFDHAALLATPDEELIVLARQMPHHEVVALYRRLWGLRLSWFEQLMMEAAGVDVEYQRRRFLGVLEEAARPAPSAVADDAAGGAGWR